MSEKKRHPHVRCSQCRRRTSSMTGMCVDCRPARKPARPTRPCVSCGINTTAKQQICTDCRPRKAEYGPEDALTGGRWVTVGGIRRYVQWTEEDRAARKVAAEAAIAEQRRQRVRALLAERYGPSGWWTRHGELYDDAPSSTGQRVAEMVEDFDQADARLDRGVA